MQRSKRRSAEEKLLYRFYEPLVLLHILDKHGGLPVSRCPSQDHIASQLDLPELRRSFLNQLSYVCDYLKGGDTVTAIALESAPSGVTFWVTSNSQISKNTKDHLNGILELLRSLANFPSEKAKNVVEEQIAERCFAFSHKRLKAYQGFMQSNLGNCLSALSCSEDAEGQLLEMSLASLLMFLFTDEILVSWLQQFQSFGANIPQLCRFAYQQRHCQCMGLLQKHIRDERAILVETESKKQYFINTRHYIGRLGSPLKAAKVLVLAGCKLAKIFENFTIQTLPSAKPPIFPPPPDDLTTLDGMVKRMLPNDSKDILRYQESLAFMDRNFQIQNQLLDQYREKEFRPRVHAELHLLEYFHTNELEFEESDKYIGCSKPACYCCYHYICHHPGGFERPATHAVRYINWRPPEISCNAATERQQKVLINKMIADIRRDVLKQIDQRAGPSRWRPDTTTGITPSLDGESLVGGMKSCEWFFFIVEVVCASCCRYCCCSNL